MRTEMFANESSIREDRGYIPSLIQHRQQEPVNRTFPNYQESSIRSHNYPLQEKPRERNSILHPGAADFTPNTGRQSPLLDRVQHGRNQELYADEHLGDSFDERYGISASYQTSSYHPAELQQALYTGANASRYGPRLRDLPTDLGDRHDLKAMQEPADSVNGHKSAAQLGLLQGIKTTLHDNTDLGPFYADDINTIFVVGFPDDMQEREFNNMFLFAQGYEGCVLKIPRGSREQNLNGRFPSLSGPAPLSISHGVSSQLRNGGDLLSQEYGPKASATPEEYQTLQGNGGSPRKQIIGFAKFRTRAHAIVAREIISGRKVDGEKVCILKAEMAKKNLHTKRIDEPFNHIGASGYQDTQRHSAMSGLNVHIRPKDEPASTLYNSRPGFRAGQYHAELDQKTASAYGDGHDGSVRHASHHGPTLNRLPDSDQENRAHSKFTGNSKALLEDDDLPSPLTYLNGASVEQIGTNGKRNHQFTEGLADLEEEFQARALLKDGVNEPASNLEARFSSASLQSSSDSVSRRVSSGLPVASASTTGMTTPHSHPDHNPPCNTLYVGNLPNDTSEAELTHFFENRPGYKQLVFRIKGNVGGSHMGQANGAMCFVEFEDIYHATKALAEVTGNDLRGSSSRGGIRLSYSKNPLGVRSTGNANDEPYQAVGRNISSQQLNGSYSSVPPNGRNAFQLAHNSMPYHMGPSSNSLTTLQQSRHPTSTSSLSITGSGQSSDPSPISPSYSGHLSSQTSIFSSVLSSSPSAFHSRTMDAGTQGGSLSRQDSNPWTTAEMQAQRLHRG